MNRLIEASFDRSRTVLLILLLVLIGGFQVYRTTPKDADPDVQVPVVYVVVPHEGISPGQCARMRRHVDAVGKKRHRTEDGPRHDLKALLQTVPGATIERNSVLLEKVPAGGLIILRDGDPGEPEQALGGFASTCYQHAVEIEVYLEEGDAAARDAAFDALLQQIGAVLEADPTLGSLAFGLTTAGPNEHRGGGGRTGDQERDPLGDRRLRDRRNPRLISRTSAGDDDGASLWFERTSAHEARDRLWPSGHRQLPPHAV
jgi:hypothetical protein